MKITLRRAKAIQADIQSSMLLIATPHMVTLNEFEDIEEVIKAAYHTLLANDARQHALTIALYDIRELVGTANAQSGIDALLTKQAYIERRIQQIMQFTSASAQISLTVLQGQMERIRKSDDISTRWRTSDHTLTTSVLSEAHIQTWKEELIKLKRQKQSLNDKVLDLNIRTEIILTEETVNTLRTERII